MPCGDLRHSSDLRGSPDQQRGREAGRRSSGLEQLVSRHAKRSGQALQIVQRDVARLALHMRHKSAVQARLKASASCDQPRVARNWIRFLASTARALGASDGGDMAGADITAMCSCR